MPPTLAQLLESLPDDFGSETPVRDADRAAFAGPVPVSGLRRASVLATLQAKIAAAYLFYWVRNWFREAGERQRALAETHLRVAAQVLDSMTYLRGAVMKLGQYLAHLPDVVPEEFVRVFSSLHFEAPPMHFALLREVVEDELGGDPHAVFAEFVETAFAAASIGQVHRARLVSGERVAVKIQYPGVARTIRTDIRNLLRCLLVPLRAGRDWQSFREQWEHVRRVIERETDYEEEARFQEAARSLFRDEDGIVVPRVFPQHSTRRVLTTDYLEGHHLGSYLATDPSQEERDRFGEKILRAWYRLFYAGRMSYVDFNPGNVLFLPDGRLGLIDFGCIQTYSPDEWELMRLSDRPLTTGKREDKLAFLREWVGALDAVRDAERIALHLRYLDWSWWPRTNRTPHDFGDRDDLQRGIEILTEILHKHYLRAHPASGMVTRWDFSYRGLLYRLGARIDVARLAEEEVRTTGWRREEYASG